KEQSLTRLRDNMDAPAPKHRKNKIITDECLVKLRQRYEDERIDIANFLKTAANYWKVNPL
ncbi:unnamed protein product, partial [Didymodactylos carnosus]